MTQVHDSDFARFDRRCHLWGWSLFIFSALFFIVASVRAGDIVSLLASLLFLVACFVFLLPYYRERRRTGGGSAGER